MKRIILLSFLFLAFTSFNVRKPETSWIRINQLGYSVNSPKVAVWASKLTGKLKNFRVIDSATNKVVYKSKAGKPFGAYGPFNETYRLDFSKVSTPGTYYIQSGKVRSPFFRIANDVYAGLADFALRYMRQQRSGFNPYLKDSCHTYDGYTMYGPMPDSTIIDVSGGWHDASDYLQYSTTSANATYHLLAAYRDFPNVFSDEHLANGLNGTNGTADVLDEARWGLEWLLKMHPKEDWLFNQLADDRDHSSFRLPTDDLVDYGMGPGKARPVYFASGQPQGLKKYKNRATGVASVAGKFASSFALAAQLYDQKDKPLSELFKQKALSAYKLGMEKPGVAQTAPHGAPYFYEEDNWVDDMELGSAALFQLTGEKRYHTQAFDFGKQEPVTPWMGADTARHYQWYPFHNFGHYELAKKSAGPDRNQLIAYYKEGIEKVWKKSQNNGFYRGVPFIWCSNNLTTSFAIQCYLYRELSRDNTYLELEQASFDWLFGVNPWGTSMVYGLPSHGDTPEDPHSALTAKYKFPIDGGLVDGPVYGSIYKKLIGITLYQPDEYAEFQSDLVVYHDDYGDYSTNEPTMDGTASLIYLLAAKEKESREVNAQKVVTDRFGAIIRGDSLSKKIALVFTGDGFADGGYHILKTLKSEKIKSSFFLTGRFYSTPEFKPLIRQLKARGHYLGAHSDQHLLYCDWTNRDSLLVTHHEFSEDLRRNYSRMQDYGVQKADAPYFLPPYEWYNSAIVNWTSQEGLQLVNFSPGTRSTADYTWPELGKSYRPSDEIYQSIIDREESAPNGLNGFILLVHIGTDPRRTDKFYLRLPGLIKALKNRGYTFERIDQMLD